MSGFGDLWGHFSNYTVLTESLKNYGRNIGIPLVIMTIAICFLVFAGVDYLLGNKFGFGECYVEAWEALPSLALGMVGITALTPVLQIVFQPLVEPAWKFIGSRPCMFAGTILAVDMGAIPFAKKMASEDDLNFAMFSSIVLGSMLGSVISFNIPIGMKILKPDHHIYFAYGNLIGLITIPFGVIIGGASMALTPYKISFSKVLINTIPVAVFTIAIGICLFLFPAKTLKGFMGFAKVINFLMVFGTILAIFQHKLAIYFPLFDTMIGHSTEDGENALEMGLLAIGEIACLLAGTLPMIHFITKFFGKYLAKLGKYARLTENDSGLVVSTLASLIPTCEKFSTMSKRGMIINSAFQVGACMVFGDHLGVVGAIQPDMITPMIIAKFSTGIFSLILSTLTADFFLRKIYEILGEEHSLSDIEANLVNNDGDDVVGILHEEINPLAIAAQQGQQFEAAEIEKNSSNEVFDQGFEFQEDQT